MDWWREEDFRGGEGIWQDKEQVGGVWCWWGGPAVLRKQAWEVCGACRVCGDVMDTCREIAGTELWQDGPSGSRMGSRVEEMYEEQCLRVAAEADLGEERMDTRGLLKP